MEKPIHGRSRSVDDELSERKWRRHAELISKGFSEQEAILIQFTNSETLDQAKLRLLYMSRKMEGDMDRQQAVAFLMNFWKGQLREKPNGELHGMD